MKPLVAVLAAKPLVAVLAAKPLVVVLATALAGCADRVDTEPPVWATPVALHPGADLPEEDVAAMVRAEQAALDEDRVVHWNGSGVLGRIIPRHQWEVDGRTCRAFDHVVASPSVIREWRGAACRAPGGEWRSTT